MGSRSSASTLHLKGRRKVPIRRRLPDVDRGCLLRLLSYWISLCFVKCDSCTFNICLFARELPISMKALVTSHRSTGTLVCSPRSRPSNLSPTTSSSSLGDDRHSITPMGCKVSRGGSWLQLTVDISTAFAMLPLAKVYQFISIAVSRL